MRAVEVDQPQHLLGPLVHLGCPCLLDRRVGCAGVACARSPLLTVATFHKAFRKAFQADVICLEKGEKYRVSTEDSKFKNLFY